MTRNKDKPRSKDKPRTVSMPYKPEHLREGAICPFCGNQDIEGGSVDIVGNETMQDCFCIACGKQWRDEYVLTYCKALTYSGRWKSDGSI